MVVPGRGPGQGRAVTQERGHGRLRKAVRALQVFPIAGDGVGADQVQDGVAEGARVDRLAEIRAADQVAVGAGQDHLPVGVPNRAVAELGDDGLEGFADFLEAVAPAEHLPYEDATFDVVFSHEVLEHVDDDRAAVREAYRVLVPGGWLVVFVPNRLYPFETHGAYWGGRYHFGNIPLINYLPNALRNRLCPHVRVYTWAGIESLLDGLDGTLRVHRCIFAGYDNVVERRPALGRALQRVTYALESGPLQRLGLSHLIVYQKAVGRSESAERWARQQR